MESLTVQFSQNYVGQEFGVAVDPENGGVDIALYTTNFNVTTTAQLAFALQAISVGGVDSTTGTQYTITIGADLSGLAADLPAINLASGDALTINGGNFTLDAGGTERGLFVESGTVDISDLTIKDAVAVGGSGGVGAAGGGGGAGLGGGLFVGQTANVSLQQVNFVSDSATGGAGGAASGEGYAGGGGLGGAGGAGGVVPNGNYEARAGPATAGRRRRGRRRQHRVGCRRLYRSQQRLRQPWLSGLRRAGDPVR